MTSPVKTRFAPSPSGDLHLGNARTALFSWLLARHLGGSFLLRIEDTDASRSSEASCQGIFDDLNWLGLGWDEGPGRDGGHGPYRQSERGEIYQLQFERLKWQDRVYPCFCSPETLAVQRKTQLAAGRPPRYAGTCARLHVAQIALNWMQGITPTWRFRVPPGERVEFIDLVKGPQSFATDDIGDFVLRRADGSAAFFFGNAVDDALMGVTEVVRGEDHLTNTPRQLLLMQALGFKPPAYLHLSLIVGEDGAPLSKRHGSTSVRDLRAQGYLPAAVVNYLARLGHSYEDNKLMSLDELAAAFEVKHVGTAPARFDEIQLEHWQKEALLKASAQALVAWLDEDTRALVPEAERVRFIDCVRPNVLFPNDAREWAERIYRGAVIVPKGAGEGNGNGNGNGNGEPPWARWPEEERAAVSGAGMAFYEAALKALEPDMDFNAFAQRVKSATGRKGKELFQPLRAALTGLLHGPEMQKLFPLMGETRVRTRFEHARAKASA